MKPYDERAETAEQIIQRLDKKMADIKGAKFYMQVPQNITVGGRLSRTQYQYTLTDTNIDELNHWAPIIEDEMRKLPELQQVASDQQIAAAHLAIEIDRDAAYRLGLSARSDRPDPLRRLRTAAGRDDLHGDQSVQGRARSAAAVPERSKPAVANLRVDSSGAQVPLSTVAHFTRKSEPLLLSHQGIFPAVTLSFNLTPGVSLGQAVSAIEAMAERLHVPATVNASFAGTAQAFRASLSSMPLLLAAAILVVYIVLGVLYESYIHPITILSALPSAGVGALLC